MPCIKCNSDFNLFNWKIKCGECEEKFCASCLRKKESLFYCETCIILLKRPPDRGRLMELKSKDLQDYLKRHNISTHGLVEKRELVDLFCSRSIPVKQKKSTDIFTTNLAYSLQNLRENPALGKFLGSESFFGTSDRHQASPSGNTQESSNAPRPPPRRRSPRNSPTSTSAQFQPSSSSSSSHSSNGNMPPAGDSTQTPSTSYDTLGSEWVYVNPDETLEETSQPKTPEGSPVPPKCPKLSEIASEADIHKLTAKQLKVLLTLNRVDFKGCVEKKDLLEKAEILWREGRKQDLPDNFEDICKLCMDAPLECVLLECGHIATCLECGKKLAECPICRQYVSRVVRTFKA